MENLETALFAGGCFWCTEAIFKRLNGVISVLAGYAGGHVENPSYEAVCTGNTGHAEAIQIRFDPSVISYKTLLEIFWNLHDPTTLNKQGADVGTQYRSSVFYYNEEQKNIALQTRSEISNEGVYADPIVTEIVPFTNFYVAENYHQDYFAVHENQPYCSIVISPKIHKLLKLYSNQVKADYL